MKISKLLMIFIFIFSFISSSVSTKYLSFCLNSHNSERQILKNLTNDNFCHEATDEKKENQLCIECDCYSNSYLNNPHSVIENKLFKYEPYKFDISLISFIDSIKDPPPKEVQLITLN